MRVLIVSEDPAELQRAGSALHLTEGIEVVEATTARAAAALAAETPFDVLVVDGDLQPKGGFSWLYEFAGEAEVRGERRPPAVVLASRDQDAWLAGWARAEAVVDKPADSFAVAAAVRSLAATAV